jgi:PAS domain-containing protein
MLPPMPPEPLDAPRLTLALVEAQVGSLVEVLPVALLVASSGGEILRANEAATQLLRHPVPLVGQRVAPVLDEARRRQSLEVRVRWLRHKDEVLRVYVIQAQSGWSTPNGPFPGAPRSGFRPRPRPVA